jgi:hypothetical protein
MYDAENMMAEIKKKEGEREKKGNEDKKKECEGNNI